MMPVIDADIPMLITYCFAAFSSGWASGFLFRTVQRIMEQI